MAAVAPVRTVEEAGDPSLTGVAGPVDERARLREIDVIRGVALFGVVLMNLDAETSWFVPTPILNGLGSARLDRAVQYGLDWLVSDKA